MKPSSERIYEELEAEREYQRKRWGDGHDNQHSMSEWIAILLDYISRAITVRNSAEAFRGVMVKIAAIAVAAIEWRDRQKEAMKGLEGLRQEQEEGK